MQFYKEKIKRLSEELKIKEEERNKKDAKNEDLEQEIKNQIRELVEVYKRTLLLLKVFPDNKTYKIALAREKHLIKSLKLKLI